MIKIEENKNLEIVLNDFLIYYNEYFEIFCNKNHIFIRTTLDRESYKPRIIIEGLLTSSNDLASYENSDYINNPDIKIQFIISEIKKDCEFIITWKNVDIPFQRRFFEFNNYVHMFDFISSYIREYYIRR